MFGRKQREIARLTRENQGLRNQVEEVKSDPFFHIAQELGAEVEGIISSGRSNVDTRVADAIARRRTALFLARIDELARAETERQTAEQKAATDEQALVEANRLAAAALERFLTGGEAGAYREEVRARLSQERPEAVLREAKQQIAAEEHQRRVEEARDRILAQRSQEAEREQMKLRAQELRTTTKRTRMLRLEELQDGDPLTIAFTQRGQGFQPLSESYGGGNSTYRSHLEHRRISGHLVDSIEGIFEAANDSWLRKPNMAEQALRGGQQVALLARERLHDEEALAPCILKGAPLVMQTMGEVALPDGGLDVWWASLGDFRVLS